MVLQLKTICCLSECCKAPEILSRGVNDYTFICGVNFPHQHRGFSSFLINHHSTDLKARRIHTVHTSVVEVIAKGQNEVSSHLLCYFAHFSSCSLLHSGDIGGVRHSTPVSYSQELNGGSVFCEGREHKRNL